MNVVEPSPYYLYSLSLLIFVFIAGLLVLARHYKPIFVSSLLALPQSLLSPLVVPEYWNPEMHLLSGIVGVEDLAFSFFTGGLVWMGVLAFHFRIDHSYRFTPGSIVRRLVFCNIFGVSAITLLYLLGLRGLSNPMVVMIVWIVLILLTNKHYFPLAVAGSLAFLVTYTLLFKATILFWPEFIFFWNFKALSGICPLGIPLEELVWAFLYGGAWSLGIAYILGFNKSGRPSTIRT